MPSDLYGDEFSTTLMSINTWGDAAFNYAFMTLVYMTTYLGISSAFELTNPKCGTPGRWELIRKEIGYGVPAILSIVAYATAWVALVEPHVPFYGYYATHRHTWEHFVAELLGYMLIFDAYFYLTHRWLHHPWMYRNIHYHHHQLYQTSAFAQDAVAIPEAVLQGPMGHFLVALLIPIHPISHALFGFLTAIYAIAAHDGREMDFNDHQKHHHFSSCNFGLYFSWLDRFFGTRYSPAKYERINTADFTNPPELVAH